MLICNEKWSVLLSCCHQGHNKCLNQCTGHSRKSYYKAQTTYHPKYLKYNKGEFPICQMKYSPEDVMLWYVYEEDKCRQVTCLPKSQEHNNKEE